MSPYWYLILIPFFGLFFARKDLRKEMIISGLLSVPVLLIKPIIFFDFLADFSLSAAAMFFIPRLIIGFCFGAIAATIYETFFHKQITPERHPERKKMIYLSAGPIIFLALILLSNLNFAHSIIIGLIVDLIIIIFIRMDLIWDMIFSGFSMALFYLILYLISFRSISVNAADFWFIDHLSSLTIFSIPIEEIIIVMLFGALWGPLYVAIKDFSEK